VAGLSVLRRAQIGEFSPRIRRFEEPSGRTIRRLQGSRSFSDQRQHRRVDVKDVDHGVLIDIAHIGCSRDTARNTP
jgi:hypothetical protein